jgi:DNA polymerase bacteriophage-type
VSLSQQFCILDYETRSEADLKKIGGFEYANHPTTQIMCAAWRVGTREELAYSVKAKRLWEKENPLASWRLNPHRAKIWSSAFKDSDSVDGLWDVFFDRNMILVAHNALFEQLITRFVLSRRLKNPDDKMALGTLPHDRWYCTAARAAACALPRNLEGAGFALKLPIQKDMEGSRLLKKYWKPRKPTKNNPAKWHSKASELWRIMQYCVTDVDTETLLFLTLPDLNPLEKQVWLLDQRINFRGFRADRELVAQVLKMIEVETGNLNSETAGLGDFESTTQRDEVLKWLEAEGVFLPDLQAKTVSDAIKEGLVSGNAKRMLEIRQAVSKTSTKKYHAFEMRSRLDGRVRDILLYHGASTGRFSGMGVQPHNFPRGMSIDTALAAEVLRTGDLELVRLIYGDPMNIFSTCLRSVIYATEGMDLFCADYAAIEARILFWVAKHADGLSAYRDNRPIYEEMAAVIFGVPLSKVTKAMREVGKRAILGCGYGMGWKKFQATCKQFGMEVDEELAQRAVNAYRSLNQPVPILWKNLERAAIMAVRNKGTAYTINRTKWWVKDNFLWCELPSGRRLAYYGPEIRWEPTPWDEKMPRLYHWGVNGYTRKWECAGTYGGKLTENVVSAIARDLMVEAMLRIEKAGYTVTLSVHDEILAEREIGQGSLEEFENLMAECPAWAEGAPVRVEGWKGKRYRK